MRKYIIVIFMLVVALTGCTSVTKDGSGDSGYVLIQPSDTSIEVLESHIDYPLPADLPWENAQWRPVEAFVNQAFFIQLPCGIQTTELYSVEENNVTFTYSTERFSIDDHVQISFNCDDDDYIETYIWGYINMIDHIKGSISITQFPPILIKKEHP